MSSEHNKPVASTQWGNGPLGAAWVSDRTRSDEDLFNARDSYMEGLRTDEEKTAAFVEQAADYIAFKKQAGMLSGALKGMGIGGVAGGVAGAATAKPGESRLKRGLMGAGAGAVGGGLIGGAAGGVMKNRAARAAQQKGFQQAADDTMWNAKIDSAKKNIAQVSAEESALQAAKSNIKVPPEMLNPKDALRHGTMGMASPAPAAQVASRPQSVQFYGLPVMQKRAARKKAFAVLPANPLSADSSATAQLGELSAVKEAGAVGNFARKALKAAKGNPYARQAAIWGGAGAVTGAAHGALTAKPGQSRLGGALRGGVLGGVTGAAGGAAAGGIEKALTKVAIRQLLRVPRQKSSKFVGRYVEPSAGQAVDIGKKYQDSRPEEKTAGEQGLNKLPDLKELAAEKYPVEEVPSFSEEINNVIDSTQRKIKDLRKTRAELVSGEKPRKHKPVLPVPEDLPSKIANAAGGVKANTILPAAFRSKRGLPIVGLGAAALGLANYLTSRPKDELGGKSRAEFDLQKEVELNKAQATDSDSFPTRMRHRMKEFQSGLATDFRKSPIAAAGVGALVGAGIGSQIAKVLGVR
jgi:hypothetical protein